MKYNNIEMMRNIAIALGMKETTLNGRTTFSGTVRGKHAFLSGDAKYGWFLRLSPSRECDYIDEVESYCISDEVAATRIAEEFGC